MRHAILIAGLPLTLILVVDAAQPEGPMPTRQLQLPMSIVCRYEAAAFTFWVRGG